MTKADTLIQGMDDCNLRGEISRLALKKRNALDNSSEKVAVINK